MKLGSFCVLQNGKSIPKTVVGNVPVYGSTGIIGFTNKSLVGEEGVLIARVGANCGMVQYLPNKPSWISDNTIICVPKKTVCLVKYLYYCLQKSNISKYRIGSAQPLLTIKILSALDIDVPSLTNQQHIVGTIGSVDDLIENIARKRNAINLILSTSLYAKNEVVPLSAYHPNLVKPGIDYFQNFKTYLDTSCVETTDPIDYGFQVSYDKRPSRANMQPSENTVWTARMKSSFKVLGITHNDKIITEKCILSTGFLGVTESSHLCLPFIYSLFISKPFRILKDLNSTGATMESINNKDFLEIKVPLLSSAEMEDYRIKYSPLLLELSSLREEEIRLNKVKESLLAKYFNH